MIGDICIKCRAEDISNEPQCAHYIKWKLCCNCFEFISKYIGMKCLLELGVSVDTPQEEFDIIADKEMEDFYNKYLIKN